MVGLGNADGTGVYEGLDVEEIGETGETGTEVEPTWCETQGLRADVFETEGEFGFRRRQLAEDFEITLLDGTQWRFSDHWTGCDAIAFYSSLLPDRGYGQRIGLDNRCLRVDRALGTEQPLHLLCGGK